MEEKLLFKMVQGQIGYNFKNLDLLKQAFIRKSYTEENGGEDNEVLEFIGDKVLDFVVVRLLSQRYGHLENVYRCDRNEGELTSLKSKMVGKKSLALRMDELGFAQHLIMGESDIQNNINEEFSVKEDLFEAIIGAVAIDSCWNLNDIQSVVEIMLNPDSFLINEEETNYVIIIQEWELKKNGVIPLYKYYEGSYESTWYIPFDGISQSFNSILPSCPSEVRFRCELKLLDSLPIFRAFGSSKSEARKAVCKLAYDYLKKHDLLFSIRDEIENPNKKDAINQLEILARRGYFSIPIYNFKEKYDNNGNPIWKCSCNIKEYDVCFCAESSSKKYSKKSAAFEMLKHILSKGDK
ncbi:hypothetical protein M9Y10_013503 [Tritrichomonas musculus]|uniref:RNase III domain-containing protein n=1 Tax=Tritrichomonas musculus TaxID=1915356 RepID=A0ABR2GN03_9EUKA